MEVSQLCGGDFALPLLIQVFDHERSGKHELIGSLQTTVTDLLKAFFDDAVSPTLTLQYDGENAGGLVVQKAALALPVDREANVPTPQYSIVYRPKPTFIDYVNGGCKLNVVVAIDFTGSNGDPSVPGTLHYLDPNGAYNDYQKPLKPSWIFFPNMITIKASPSLVSEQNTVVSFAIVFSLVRRPRHTVSVVYWKPIIPSLGRG